MRIRIQATVVAVVIAIVASTSPAAAQPVDGEPPYAFGIGAGIDVGGGFTEQSAGPPALVRKLRPVLPTLRQLPVGSTVERVRPGNGEACPGVRARGPRAQAAVVRSFEIPGNELLFVQVVAFERPRQAQRALDTWFRQNVRDCRRFGVDDFTFVTRRTRPPLFGIGDTRKAIRTRITYDDPTFGRIHAGERAVAVYRDGRYLLLAGSTGVLAFLGDIPKPNFGRWADSIEFMYDRAGRLPR